MEKKKVPHDHPLQAQDRSVSGDLSGIRIEAVSGSTIHVGHQHQTTTSRGGETIVETQENELQFRDTIWPRDFLSLIACLVTLAGALSAAHVFEFLSKISLLVVTLPTVAALAVLVFRYFPVFLELRTEPLARDPFKETKYFRLSPKGKLQLAEHTLQCPRCEVAGCSSPMRMSNTRDEQGQSAGKRWICERDPQGHQLRYEWAYVSQPIPRKQVY